MIRQSQSDALIDFIDRKIDDIQDEIRYEEACWDEAPARNKSDWLEMKWSDAVADLEWKLNEWKQLRRDAEDIEIAEDVPAVLPTMATARLGAFALGTLAVLGLFLVPVLVGICFLFENSEFAWR